jgi:hypothetical protein
MLEQDLIEKVYQLFRSLLQIANTKGEKASQRLTLIVQLLQLNAVGSADDARPIEPLAA